VRVRLGKRQARNGAWAGFNTKRAICSCHRLRPMLKYCHNPLKGPYDEGGMVDRKPPLHQKFNILSFFEIIMNFFSFFLTPLDILGKIKICVNMG
jgi:hypothetical protein